MCGIVGWVSYDRDFKADEAVIVSKMTETMARRGPDAGGVWIDRHVGLGHRRLAVIDLIDGAQPMQAEERGRPIASLVYTGEVYNFVELRDELTRLSQPKQKVVEYQRRTPESLHYRPGAAARTIWSSESQLHYDGF